MLMNLNGRERTLTAFESLCKAVTPEMKIREVHRPEQGELSLIEITRADATWDATRKSDVNGNGH
jgi:6-hydroxytryprostatin B O-methyltransferase